MFEEESNITDQSDIASDSPPIVFHMDATRFCVICCYSILLGVGLVANGYVAHVLIRLLINPRCRSGSGCGSGGGCAGGTTATNNRRLKSRYDATRRLISWYILGLCVIDLLVLFFLFFLLADLIFGEWIVSSSLLCRLYLSTEGLNKFGAPFLLLSMSGFCYSSVTVASSSRRKHACSQAFARTSTTFGLFGVCAVVVAGLSSPLYLYGDIHWIALDDGDFSSSSSPTSWPMARNVTKCGFLPPQHVLTAFVTYGFILGYCVPAGAFTFFYVSLVRLVRRRGTGGGREIRVARLARVSWTSIIMVAFYLLCWSPYHFLNIFQYFSHREQPENEMVEEQSQVLTVLSYFVHILPYVNCTGFPLLYVLSNSTIKEAYSRLRRCQPGQVANTLDVEMRNVSSLSRSYEIRHDSLL